MISDKAKFGVVAFVVLLAILTFIGCTSAKTITVGDDTGIANYTSAGDYTITIEPDPSYPGWSDYDYAIGSDDISFSPEKPNLRENVTISADIHNLGLCQACGGWGWYSPEGRSSWGEWDFEYDKAETVNITFRAGDDSPEPGAKYRIELDGEHLGDAQIPATNSWYLVTIHNVSISPGNHTIFLGTYQMDLYPDIHLDYIQIGHLRMEAESYDRMGGNDPNPDWRGLSVYPIDIVVQFWDGNPHEGGVLISEQVVGKLQLVIDAGHQYPDYTYYAHYIENNGTATAKTVWTATEGTHDIYVLIDPNDDLSEVNEDNNIAYKTITPISGIFDTGPSTNPYPSIFGTHIGKIKPNHDVIVNKMYTYSCSATGGHTEYVRFENESWNITASWKGYQGDWHNITFDESFTLYTGLPYNYTIRTGSYPQIHHNRTLTVPDGEITCIEFIDANGERYNDWIPAIRLE